MLELICPDREVLPGLSTVAPPLAGMVGIPRAQMMAARAARRGHWLGLIAALAIGGYIGQAPAVMPGAKKLS